MLARLALACAALLLFALFAELALRVVSVGQVMTYERDPAYGYRMRPSQLVSTYGDPIEINAIGLRGPEVIAARPPGVVRVLFLGDSITYGGGRVHEGDLFCRQIEYMARNDGLRVEAVNVSAPGWSPQNWTIWVERHGALGADLAVMVLPETDRARPFATLESARLVEHAPLLRLGSIWLRIAALFADTGPRQDDPLAHNLEALHRLSEALGAIPLVAVFVPGRDPDPTPELWAPFEALYPNALDLRGKLGPGDFADDVHLSTSGHHDVAGLLYPELRPRFAELTVGAARGVR
jgi:hypothetical protein